MKEQRFIQLLMKKKSGELSLLEHQEFNSLLDENPDFAGIASGVNELFDNSIYSTEVNEKLWDSINHKITAGESNTNKRTKIITPFFWKSVVAAAAIVVFVLVGVKKFASTENIQQLNIVSTKKGSKSNLVLPDGTRVSLNADSKITYNENFGNKKREIYLEGEAYFDVAKNARAPLVIHTRVLDVKVLGTTFNVRAYPNENTTETALFRGSVQIIVKSNREQVFMMQPNQKMVVQNDFDSVSKAPAEGSLQKDAFLPNISLTKIKQNGKDSLPEEVQWTNNRLVFENRRLEEVALQISRWYDVEVVIEEDSLKDNKYSGIFKGLGVDQVMESLSAAGGFHYTIKGNIITIKR